MNHSLSFFVEYNFEVKYKPGMQNVLEDIFSRRSYYDLFHVTTLSSHIGELICVAYPRDSQCVALFHAFKSEGYKGSDNSLSTRFFRASLRRYYIDNGLLCYRTDATDDVRIVMLHDEDLKYRILF